MSSRESIPHSCSLAFSRAEETSSEKLDLTRSLLSHFSFIPRCLLDIPLPPRVVEITLKSNGLSSLVKQQEGGRYVSSNTYFSSWVRVKRLDLSWNRLSIPQLYALCGMTALQVLDISFNKTLEIPASINRLSSLKIIRANDNQLRTIPPEIGDLRNLEELHLGYNKLETLPTTLSKLSRLRVVDCIGNVNMIFPTYDVILGGTQSIISFLSLNMLEESSSHEVSNQERYVEERTEVESDNNESAPTPPHPSSRERRIEGEGEQILRRSGAQRDRKVESSEVHRSPVPRNRPSRIRTSVSSPHRSRVSSRPTRRLRGPSLSSTRSAPRRETRISGTPSLSVQGMTSRGLTGSRVQEPTIPSDSVPSVVRTRTEVANISEEEMESIRSVLSRARRGELFGAVASAIQEESFVEEEDSVEIEQSKDKCIEKKETVSRRPPSPPVLDLKYPAHFLCPITYEVMRDPVVASDGHSYGRKSIEKWLQQSSISPMTGLKLRSREVTPNYTLRSMLLEFEQEAIKKEKS